MSPAESLREKLIFFLEYAFPKMPREERLAQCARLVDDYAHELAEQIRAYADDEFPDGDSNPQEFYGDWGSFFREAADLIDPEADESAGPARPDEEPTP